MRLSGLKAVAFDFGHALVHERDVPLASGASARLMPGVSEVLPQLELPLAVWANTRVAAEADVRNWLDRAGIGAFFRWVVTSVDAGARKPDPAFFQYALGMCGLGKADVLFVGNQLNTDVAGAEACDIATVWLSGADYHSDDDAPCDARPTYTITTLREFPALLRQILKSSNS